MKLEELLQRYRVGERNFRGQRLYGQALNADLQKINLSNANLETASLVESNLEGADLSGAILCGADLKGVNLTSANLSRANFCVSSQDYSSPAESSEDTLDFILENSLIPPEFSEIMRESFAAQMRDVAPREVLSPSSLINAILDYADFSEADLRKAFLNNAKLRHANLANANLAEADLTGADLTGANLTRANLSSANLSQANLSGAILTGANFQDAILGWTVMPDGEVRNDPVLDLIPRKMEPLKRKAWKPVTVRQEGDLQTSKFAGKPWLNANEQWPLCQNCGNPLHFFLQLNLQELPKELHGKFGSGILQLFYCLSETETVYDFPVESAIATTDSNGTTTWSQYQSCESDCMGWAAFSDCHLVRIIQPTELPATYELPDQTVNSLSAISYRLSNGKFPTRLIVDWQEMDDYPDWEEAESFGINLEDDEVTALLNTENNYDYSDRAYASDEEVAGWVIGDLMHETRMYPTEGDKLSGWSHWVQGVDYPNCPECDRIMNQPVFEFASDDNIPFLWGDAGRGYIVQCPTHREQLAFSWQGG